MQLSDFTEQLAALPDGASLPVAWIREQLAKITPETREESADVLDVARLATRWDRSRSAVRALLEAGAIPQAWKQGGKAWRVRLADVEAYERAEAARTQRAANRSAVPNLRAIARGDAA